MSTPVVSWPEGLKAEEYREAAQRAKDDPEYLEALTDLLHETVKEGDRRSLFPDRETVRETVRTELEIQAFTLDRLQSLTEALGQYGLDLRVADMWPGVDTEYFEFPCPNCKKTVNVSGINTADGTEPAAPFGWARVSHTHGCPMSEGGYLAALMKRLSVEVRVGADLDFIRARRKIEGDQVDWLLPGVMERGKLIALFGPPKAGKSLLVLQWAADLARSGLKVVYLDEENDLTEVDIRLESISPGGIPETLAYHSFQSWTVDTEDGAEAIVEACQGADLVVFDSWAKFFLSGGQSDDASANRAYRFVLKPLRAAGIGVIRIDHSGHEESRRPAGSIQKLADVDHNWMLRAAKADRGQAVPLTLTHTENRTGRGDDVILLRRDGKTLRHTVLLGQEGGEVEGANDPAKVAALVEVLDQMGIPTDWTVRATQGALQKAGKGARTGLVSEAQKLRR